MVEPDPRGETGRTHGLPTPPVHRPCGVFPKTPPIDPAGGGNRGGEWDWGKAWNEVSCQQP